MNDVVNIRESMTHTILSIIHVHTQVGVATMTVCRCAKRGALVNATTTLQGNILGSHPARFAVSLFIIAQYCRNVWRLRLVASYVNASTHVLYTHRHPLTIGSNTTAIVHAMPADMRPGGVNLRWG